MFQIDKKSSSKPTNKDQKDKKSKTNIPDYYSIMQEQNKAFIPPRFESPHKA
jgi:hypothetical protein